MEPGGSGDPYAGLNTEQAAALHEVTRMGFPLQSWFGWKTMGIHGFAALYGGVVMADPGYFTDFWTKPGYYGFDHPESFVGYRMQHKATIAALVTGADAQRQKLETSVTNGKTKGTGNTKCGNRHLAWAFIEAAHFAVRYDETIRRWFQKKTARTLQVVAIKAVAHKLARACFHVMKTGTPFDVARAFG